MHFKNQIIELVINYLDSTTFVYEKKNDFFKPDL